MVGEEDRLVARRCGQEPRDVLEAQGPTQDRRGVRKGELSAAELGPAATPENEGRLLDAARKENVRDLKKTRDKEKARTRSADEEAKRHARIHKERHYRSWTDAEGAYCFAGRCTATEGAKREAAIAAEQELIFKQAYAAGKREPAAAYRSDAVTNLLCGGGANVSTEVVIRVDEATLRGEDGGCETTTGPIPVDEAIGAILARAFVTILSTDGVDVQKVARPGRDRGPWLDAAIFERDNYRCQRPGCGATQRLQVHHYKIDYGKQGPTAYWNLVTLCRFDHDLVTHGGHRIDGRPGQWQWIPPP